MFMGTNCPVPFVFYQELPPLKAPALKVYYITVILKLNEPVSQSALCFSNYDFVQQ